MTRIIAKLFARRVFLAFYVTLGLAFGSTILLAGEADQRFHAMDLTGAWTVTNTGVTDPTVIFLAVNTFTSDGGWVGSGSGGRGLLPDFNSRIWHMGADRTDDVRPDIRVHSLQQRRQSRCYRQGAPEYNDDVF
jgi:hypothetical protein